MSSRYLATVRRATWMPSPREHPGELRVAQRLAGSSSAISLRMLARIAVEEMSCRPRPRPGWKRSSGTRTCRAACACTCRRSRARSSIRACDGLGDVAQDHRPHVFLALLEERAWRSTMVRATLISVSLRISRLFSSQRASCSWARSLAFGRRRPPGRIALVHLEARHRRRIDLHRPAPVGAPHEHVGNDVLRLARPRTATRARMAAADQRRAPPAAVLVAGTAAAARRCRDRRRPQVLARNRGARSRPGVRVRAGELQADALAPSARRRRPGRASARSRAPARPRPRSRQVGAQAARDVGQRAR